jgi:DNA-binding protein YbaB
MFNPLKQAGELKKLRDEAKKIERELEQIEVHEEKNDIEVTVSGNMKVLSVKIDGEDREDVAEVLNNAMKEAQKKAAMKMAQMGGGLKGLLGG